MTAFFREAWWVALLPGMPNFLAQVAVNTGVARRPDLLFPAARILGEILSLAVVYCVVRFIALSHNRAKALRGNRASLQTFAPYAAFGLALGLIDFALPDDLPPLASASWALSTGLVLPPLIALWTVTAPSGGTVIGPFQSASAALRHLPRLVGYMTVLMLLFVPLLLFAAFLQIRVVGDGFSALRIGPLVIIAVLEGAMTVAVAAASCAMARSLGLRVEGPSRLAAIFE